MTSLGELCLLTAFIGSGYAAFAMIFGTVKNHRGLTRAGAVSALIGFAGLTLSMAVLAQALVVKDFRFKYVSDYSSSLLPWYYSLSALWVGQAGSLLLWAWMLALLALVFRFVPVREDVRRFRDPAFGFVLAFECFLIATMVFGVDPMQVNVAPGNDGEGLSPLLQHPAMLIHPPIVFLGYAAWCFPIAIAVSALLRLGTFKSHTTSGRPQETNDAVAQCGKSSMTSAANSAGVPVASLGAEWIHAARPWALFAWIVLGCGILLGAEWSYEELGWGGYWGWDPVENGSLIPWLTGTALLHGMMAWRFLGILKKSTIALAIATFGLCNFATFLTRSGIFSSLHAFSRSPIGWLFLGLMIVLALGGALLLRRRWSSLKPERSISALWSREAQIVISSLALLSLAAVAAAGTVSVALSDALMGRRVVVGPAFYNNVLMPTGLVLLFTIALAPLLRWGRLPTFAQWKSIRVAAVIAAVSALAAWCFGLRHPLAIAVAALSAFAGATLAASLVIDARKLMPARPWLGGLAALATKRREYASFLIHMGFVCVAVGVTGSSLGAWREELVLRKGEQVQAIGRVVCFVELNQVEQADKLIAEAELEVSASTGGKVTRLNPARHLHRLQNEWTTEVAIHSTWSGDLYAILHGSEADDAVRITLVENPLIRFLWLGGIVMGVGSLINLIPTGIRSGIQRSVLPRPKFASRMQTVRSKISLSMSKKHV